MTNEDKRTISLVKTEVKLEDYSKNPILAPYHRAMEDMEKMPILERTKTVCPECKLIIDGTIYKDEENVMIRKNCPEHGWTIEKYWEDYDMYIKMKNYNYYGRGFDNPNYVNKGENCPFDCGICERHKSHTGLANVVITNRCHLSCWYCFSLSLEGILPTRETGWKFTAFMTSLLLSAKLIMFPSSWSFIVLITVGTSTTPMPAFLHESRVDGASQWFFGFDLFETPS